MQFSQSVIFFLAILLLTLSTTCNPGVPFRRLPFNGSMYGKRASSALPMDYRMWNSKFDTGPISSQITTTTRPFLHCVNSQLKFAPLGTLNKLKIIELQEGTQDASLSVWPWTSIYSKQKDDYL